VEGKDEKMTRFFLSDCMIVGEEPVCYHHTSPRTSMKGGGDNVGVEVDNEGW